MHMERSPSPDRVRCSAVACRLAFLALTCAAGLAHADDVTGVAKVLRSLDAELRVTGMTFVSSRGDVSEFVLRAERAVFLPEKNVAELEDVGFLDYAAVHGRAPARRGEAAAWRRPGADDDQGLHGWAVRLRVLGRS